MNLHYINVESSDRPVAVEVLRVMQRHVVVQSLDSERVWQRQIDLKVCPLYSSFESAKRTIR
jgi:hypothetical protein